jgi:transcription antitermination protein NusB
VTSRRADRRSAIEILYQADVTGEAAGRVLLAWRDADRPVPPFTAQLVDGVQEHEPDIDLLLEEHSEGWTVSRMTALDRTILRLAVFELLHSPDVPASVAISEAVEAAAELSSEEARPFVNGVLGKIAIELGRDPGPVSL